MLFSLAVIFLCGMLLGGLCKKLKLPPLLGMLLTGILLGPHALDVLDGSILAISADLRRIALIIILTRAGLNLELADLKRAGRPAVLLCFVPACFEIAGMVLLAPRLLGISVSVSYTHLTLPTNREVVDWVGLAYLQTTIVILSEYNH